MIKQAKIIGVQHSLSSGLSHILFDNGEFVHVESGFGMRQLAQALDERDIIKWAGRELKYTVDGFGILEGFDIVQ